MRATRPGAALILLILVGCQGSQPSSSASTEASPSTAATAEPTATPEATAEPTATPEVTEAPTATPVTTGDALDFNAAPVDGSTSLESGFTPDPFTATVTAGGPVDASYLGTPCRGSATVAPTYSITYTSGTFDTLRFYAVGEADTTMIVNNPAGDFFCGDDSFGTLHPTVDFEDPASGRYDVWVATYAAGTTTNATLYVTEVTSNQPS